jgi:prepilin-type N-terminal cleavage/methylation domain-containing protein
MKRGKAFHAKRQRRQEGLVHCATWRLGVRGLPRGFTLLELLIAIGLMLALAAVVIPITISGSAEREFETSLDRIAAQALLARSQALRAGRAIELVCVSQQQRTLEARWFDPATAFVDPVGPVDRSGGGAGAAEPARIGESWARLELPGGLSWSDRPPGATENAAEDEAARDRDDAAVPGSIRLAVFLPDGSAILRRTTWLNDGEGRGASIAIDPFSAEAVIERVTGGKAAAAPDEPAHAPPEAPAEPGGGATEPRP